MSPWRSTGQPSLNNTTTQRWALAAILVGLITACCHFVYGIWFVTRSPTDMPRTSVSLKGEEFLASYPGWGDRERDAAVQNRAAIEIMRTGLPRTKTGALMLHNPVYNYFLAACYSVGGLRLLSVAIPQALLSGAIALLLAFIALRLFPRETAAVGVFGGGLVLINEPIARATAYMVPTQLLIFLFCCGLYLATAQAPRGRTWLGLVLLIGLAIYTQAVFFVVGVGVALWLVLEAGRRRDWKSFVAGAVLALLALGKPVVELAQSDPAGTDTLHDDARATLWILNNPYYENARWWERYRVRFDAAPRWNLSADQLRRYDEYLARAGDASRAGWLYVRENLAQFAKLSFIRMWTGIIAPDGVRWQRQLIAGVLWLLIFPAGFYGLWKNRALPFSKLAGLVILATFAFLTFVHPGSRYRLPADIVLTIYAAFTYARGYRLWRDRAGRNESATGFAH